MPEVGREDNLHISGQFHQDRVPQRSLWDAVLTSTWLLVKG